MITKNINMTDVAKVIQLDCSWQGNSWGRQGADSEVAKLLKCCDSNFEIDDQATYAELWVGTHRKWPSLIHGTKQTLENWLLEHPECLGDDVISRFGHHLPFMLKVLSIKMTLSLQAHPGKELARRLYARDPINNLDSNHKPEMCVALTPFRAMCGFRPIKDVARFLNDIEEFAAVVGEKNAENMLCTSEADDAEQHALAIKCCFTALMRRDVETVRTELRKLVNKVKQLVLSGGDTSSYEADVLLKLYSEYPDDVGCFSVYFLNVINLQPGEAIFIATGVMHAYLEGDCIECLACSDNILRAGLTAKYKDIDTLVDILSYSGKPGDQYMLCGETTEENGCFVQTFTPPVDDFSLIQIQIPECVTSTQLPAMSSGSLVLCIKGQGSLSSQSRASAIVVRRGMVLFISAHEECTLNTEGEMLLYRALVGLRHF